MSERLPVGDVLNESFRFGLQRWGTIIRFGWLPILVTIAIAVGVAFLILDVAALEAEEDAAALMNFRDYMNVSPAVAGLISLPAYALILLIFSGFIASIYRLAALGEERSGFFHLRIDGPTFRVFWAVIILTLINYAIFGVGFFVALAMTGQTAGAVFGAIGDLFNIIIAAGESGDTPPPEMFATIAEPLSVFFLAFVIAALPMIYVGVKLTPFPAGSAAENRLLLLGSFGLTKGHFWSIFGIWLLLFIALGIFGLIFGITTEIIEQLAALVAGQGGALAVIGAVLSLMVFVATIFYQAFAYGVQFGAQAIIYRRLKTGI